MGTLGLAGKAPRCWGGSALLPSRGFCLTGQGPRGWHEWPWCHLHPATAPLSPQLLNSPQPWLLGDKSVTQPEQGGDALSSAPTQTCPPYRWEAAAAIRAACSKAGRDSPEPGEAVRGGRSEPKPHVGAGDASSTPRHRCPLPPPPRWGRPSPFPALRRFLPPADHGAAFEEGEEGQGTLLTTQSLCWLVPVPRMLFPEAGRPARCSRGTPLPADPAAGAASCPRACSAGSSRRGEHPLASARKAQRRSQPPPSCRGCGFSSLLLAVSNRFLLGAETGPVQAAFRREIPSGAAPELSAPGFEAGEPGMTFLWLLFNPQLGQPQARARPTCCGLGSALTPRGAAHPAAQGRPRGARPKAPAESRAGSIP